jgi:hypothetical protein
MIVASFWLIMPFDHLCISATHSYFDAPFLPTGDIMCIACHVVFTGDGVLLTVNQGFLDSSWIA